MTDDARKSSAGILYPEPARVGGAVSGTWVLRPRPVWRNSPGRSRRKRSASHFRWPGPLPPLDVGDQRRVWLRWQRWGKLGRLCGLGRRFAVSHVHLRR